VVVAAWNEGPRLPARLINLLEQDYPPEKLDVVVVSDGSTDETDVVVRQFETSRIRLVKLQSRQGKAIALNHGVSDARGEIVVFADARQRFAKNAIARLVQSFADSRVGAVSGELVFEPSSGNKVAEGAGLYWGVEKWIRRRQAAIDSVIGATGAIYAIRRQLYEELPQGAILDDLLIPMRIAMRGYRVVFESGARAFDRIAPSYKVEFYRKVRTLTGNYQAMRLCPDLMNPGKNRLFWQFVSHKVTRLVAPFAALTLLFSNIVYHSGGYAYLLGIQMVAYGMALLGWAFNSLGIRERWTTAAFTFCLLNYAALVSGLRFLRGDPGHWSKAPL